MRCIEKLLIGLLILVVAIYPASGVISNSVPVANVNSRIKPANDDTTVTLLAPRYDVEPPVYNTIIRDSSISGFIEIADESRVLIEDVDFVGPTNIVIRGNACAVLKNFRVPYHLFIQTLDNSHLKLVAGDIQGSLSIEMRGGSRVHIESYSVYRNVAINCFEGSQLYLAVDIEDSSISLFDNATVHASEINLRWTWIKTYGHSVVVLNKTYSSESNWFLMDDFSRIIMNEADLQLTSVTLNDAAYLHSKDSELYSVEMFNNSSILLERSNIYSVYSYSSGGFTITDSFVDDLRTEIHIGQHEPVIYSGGYIANSIIGEATLRSPGLTYLVNSRISVLNYLVIHNDTLMVNETHVISTSNYTNFINLSSEIDSAYALSEFVADKASLVIFNRSNAAILLIDVESTSIYNAYAVIPVRSNVFVKNTTISGTMFFAYNNTNLYIKNSTVNVMIGIFGSHLEAEQIGGHANILAWNSRILIENSNLNLPTLLLFNSSIAIFNNTTISAQIVDVEESYLHLLETIMTVNPNYEISVRGRVIFENSYVTAKVGMYLKLANGSFVISNGTIINTNNEYGIISGILVKGMNTLNTEIRVYYIEAIGCNLTFENYLKPTLELPIDISSSNLLIRNVNVRSNIHVLDSSEIKIEAASLMRIYGEVARIEVKNSTVGEINLDKMIARVERSRINVIRALEGSAEINQSNISLLEFGSPEAYLTLNFPTTTVFIKDSNIWRVTSFSGKLHIENSVIKSIISIFTSVNITNYSNVDFAWENFLINVAGNVVIDSNNIPPGTYINLLRRDASSVVNRTAPGVLANISGLNLTIMNSLFVIVCGFNAAFHIINSNVAVLWLLRTQQIDIVDVDTTFMTEPPPVALGGASVRVSGLNAPGGLFILGSDVAIIQNILARYVFCLPNFEMLYNPPIPPIPMPFPMTYLNLRDGAIEDMFLAYVTGTIRNVNLTHADILSASVIFNNTRSSSMNVLYSNLTITQSMISNLFLGESAGITIYDSSINFIAAASWWWTEYPKNEYLHTLRSAVNTTYVHYIITDAHFSLQGPRLDVPFLRTLYENTTVHELDRAMIDIFGLSIVNITGFRNTTIGVLRVYCRMDEKPPTIVVKVDTPIEYELGIEKNLIFVISDETPEEYWILLNNSEVLRHVYSSGTQIIVSLEDLIDAHGNYIAQIYASDRFKNMNSVEVLIVVHPKEPPVITFAPPRIINLTLGESIELSWIVRDKSPDTYEVYINGNLSASGFWLSDLPVEYNFTAHSAGKYNVSIVFKDRLNQATIDSIIINVMEQPTPAAFPTIIILTIVIVIGLLSLIALLLRKRKI